MEICDFVYHRPASRIDACSLGLQFGENARFLAGGTELLPDLKQHRDTTQHLIDLGAIPGLDEIRHDGEHLTIGALAPLNAIAGSEAVRSLFPALAEAILMMAAVQIRNRGTLAGNFCGGVPSADTPPICIAARGEVRITGTEGVRSVEAERFFLAPRRVALNPGEIMTEIRIPISPPSVGMRYERFSLRRATALAVVGVAALLRMEGARIVDARIVLGAVAPVPMLAARAMELLAGQAAGEDLFERAAKAAAEEARPITDLRGSAEFRREIVRTLTLRALRTAAQRAEPVGRAAR
jgi:carbon-monoxide dehydrogenase medium subunit